MHKLRLCLPLLLIIGLVNCGGNSAPVVNKQVTSLQVLQRLNELEDVVIDGYATNSITPAHAVLYSKFVVSATNTVKTLPAGWQTTVKTAWAEVEKTVPLSQMEPKVQVTAKLIDALLAAL